MANISQGAPGSVDTGDGEVTLVHSESNIVNGDRRSVELFSDGSRKHYVNGVLTDDVTILSDEEKTNVVVPEGLSDLTEVQKNEIAVAHGLALDPDAPEVEAENAEVEAPVNTGPTPTETSIDEDHLTASDQAEVIALHADDVPGKDVFAVEQPDLGENQITGEPKTEEKPEDLDEFTVNSLKAHADEKSIDLGDAKLKDEIKAKIEEWYDAAKNEVEDVVDKVEDKLS